MRALIETKLTALNKSKIPMNEDEHVVPCADGFAHHWEIEEPKGTYALGMCKNCSIVRKFYNALPRVQHNPWVSKKDRRLDNGTEQPPSGGAYGNSRIQSNY